MYVPIVYGFLPEINVFVFVVVDAKRCKCTIVLHVETGVDCVLIDIKNYIMTFRSM